MIVLLEIIAESKQNTLIKIEIAILLTLIRINKTRKFRTYLHCIYIRR